MYQFTAAKLAGALLLTSQLLTGKTALAQHRQHEPAVRYGDESYKVERFTFGNLTGRFNHTYDGSHFGLVGYFAF